MHTAQEIEKAIRAAADPGKVKTLSGFFKTGKGQYGENDIFIGVPVPVIRSIAKQYIDTPLAELSILLHSPVHELRMAALLCMVEQFKKADEPQRAALYNAYLAHTACINNWDLVDLSASQIVGGYLEHRDHAPLYRLAQSPLLWEQRIAIVATWQWIRRGHLDDTLALADLLVGSYSYIIGSFLIKGGMALFIGALDECEFERYAPGDVKGNMSKTFEAAMTAIMRIEETMKKRKKGGSVQATVLLALLLWLPLASRAITKANADSAYARQQYQQAIKDYEELLGDGVSAELYYNLGNAYYRTDNITRAVLNYERALLLSPGDGDIRFNLQMARSKTIDKITQKAIPTFFILQKIRFKVSINQTWDKRTPIPRLMSHYLQKITFAALTNA